jgi:hypothetical protein
MEQYGQAISPESLALERRQTLKRKKSLTRLASINEIQDNANISIISMNLTEKKYYIYGTNGILENRVDYEELDALYGSPVSTSSSG